MVFEGLYGAFGGVDTMVVRFDKLDVAVLCCEELFDGCVGLVVCDVECWCVTIVG